MTNQEAEKGGWSVTKIISYIIIILGASLAMIWVMFLLSHAIAGLVVVAWLGLPIWVYYDARNRGMDKPLVWAILVLFSFFIGLLIYLIVRPEIIPATTCPKCQGKVESTFTLCPHCGYDIRSSSSVCPGCGKEIDALWKYCPYCRQPIKEDRQQS